MDCLYTPGCLYNNPHLADPQVLDHLQRARLVSADSFQPGVRIDVSADAVGQWKIFRAPHLLPLLTRTAREHKSNASAVRMGLDLLVAEALRHVTVPRRREGKVLDEDLLLHGDYWLRGGYFPHLHWDTDWFAFPEVDGFQLWYLLENHWEPRQGNMFMVQSPVVHAGSTPVRFEMRGGRVVMVHHPGAGDPVVESPFRSFNSLQEMGADFSYLDMRPGDCMIFSKRTLHMSDPRPVLKGHAVTRHSVNVRALVRPEGKATVNFWPNNIYARRGEKMKVELNRVRQRLCGRGREGGRNDRCMVHPDVEEVYHQAAISRYEMLKPVSDERAGPQGSTDKRRRPSRMRMKER